MKVKSTRRAHLEGQRAGRTRPARPRRSFAEGVGRSLELLYLAQGLTVAVMLTGMLLILGGMGLSLAQYAGDLSALASEEGPAEVALAGIGDFERPALPPVPTRALEPDPQAAPENAAGAGFVPLEVARDRAGERAPALPAESAPAAAAQEPQALYLPLVQSPQEVAEGQGAVAARQEVAAQQEVAGAQESAAQEVPAARTGAVLPPGPPDQIIIPHIDLIAPVVLAPVHTIEVRGQVFEQWRAPDYFAAGWQQGSALAGAPGNTVITGHHNINGEVFRRLHELEQGDDVFLRSGENAYLYTISQVMIFEERGVSMEQRQENARWILDSDDERLTLVTCWPPDSNTHRLIVVAVPNP